MTRKYTAYAENAPGDFYVEAGQCITCMNPEHVAPSLIGFCKANPAAMEHCYFKKQPDGPKEIDLAIKAVGAACCGAYHYSGTDPEIKARLRKQGDAHAIDHVD